VGALLTSPGLRYPTKGGKVRNMARPHVHCSVLYLWSPCLQVAAVPVWLEPATCLPRADRREMVCQERSYVSRIRSTCPARPQPVLLVRVYVRLPRERINGFGLPIPHRELIPFRGPAITLLHSFLSPPFILPGSAFEIITLNSFFFFLFPPFVDDYSRIMVGAIGVPFRSPELNVQRRRHLAHSPSSSTATLFISRHTLCTRKESINGRYSLSTQLAL
jgi:hypothetical protein